MKPVVIFTLFIMYSITASAACRPLQNTSDELRRCIDNLELQVGTLEMRVSSADLKIDFLQTMLVQQADDFKKLRDELLPVRLREMERKQRK